MLRVSGYARTEETGSKEHENSPGSPKDEEGAGKTPQQTLAEQVKLCIILFYNYTGCCRARKLTAPCLVFRTIPKPLESYTSCRLSLALPPSVLYVSLFMFVSKSQVIAGAMYENFNVLLKLDRKRAAM